MKCKLNPGWSWGFVSLLGRLRYLTRIVLAVHRWFIAVALLLGWAEGESHSLQVWPHPVRCFLHWVLLFLTEANSQHLLKIPPMRGGENLPLTWLDWIFSFSLGVCSSANLLALSAVLPQLHRCLWQLLSERTRSSFNVKVNLLKTLHNCLSL